MFVKSARLNITKGFIAAMLLLASLFALQMQQPAYARDFCTNTDPPACQACIGAGGDYVPANATSNDECNGDASTPSIVGDDSSVFESVINILTFVVGAISVIMLIVGGLRYVLSAGDANSTKGAKDTILYAIVGLVVAFAARAIVFFIIGRL